jgi:Xaa-Pro aminopeptidase
MDHNERLAALEQELARRKVDALLVSHLPNIRYLTGFTGSAGLLLTLAGGQRRFFTDGRYREQAAQEVRGTRVVIPRGSVLEAAARACGRLGIRSLAIEADHTTIAARQSLVGKLPAGVRLRSASWLVEGLRIVKDADEIERIRRAVLLGSSLFESLVESIRPGVPEAEVAAKLEYAARMAGADGMSFETIVAAGARSALPHGRASAQPMPRRGFVILDFGVILDGYCSDMTRTVHVGRPSGRACAMYEAVRRAQQAAIDAVRPGATAEVVDRAARSVLRRSGFGSYFSHSTGHGVGLEIHEAPRLAKGQREGLRPGMVVTIEPGIYIPGEGGIRIEDMVAVTASGCDVITPTPKDLMVL